MKRVNHIGDLMLSDSRVAGSCNEADCLLAAACSVVNSLKAQRCSARICLFNSSSRIAWPLSHQASKYQAIDCYGRHQSAKQFRRSTTSVRGIALQPENRECVLAEHRKRAKSLAVLEPYVETGPELVRSTMAAAGRPKALASCHSMASQRGLCSWRPANGTSIGALPIDLVDARFQSLDRIAVSDLASGSAPNRR